MWTDIFSSLVLNYMSFKKKILALSLIFYVVNYLMFYWTSLYKDAS